MLNLKGSPMNKPLVGVYIPQLIGRGVDVEGWSRAPFSGGSRLARIVPFLGSGSRRDSQAWKVADVFPDRSQGEVEPALYDCRCVRRGTAAGSDCHAGCNLAAVGPR